MARSPRLLLLLLLPTACDDRGQARGPIRQVSRYVVSRQGHVCPAMCLRFAPSPPNRPPAGNGRQPAAAQQSHTRSGGIFLRRLETHIKRSADGSVAGTAVDSRDRGGGRPTHGRPIFRRILLSIDSARKHARRPGRVGLGQSGRVGLAESEPTHRAVCKERRTQNVGHGLAHTRALACVRARRPTSISHGFPVPLSISIAPQKMVDRCCAAMTFFLDSRRRTSNIRRRSADRELPTDRRQQRAPSASRRHVDHTHASTTHAHTLMMHTRSQSSINISGEHRPRTDACAEIYASDSRRVVERQKRNEVPPPCSVAVEKCGGRSMMNCFHRSRFDHTHSLSHSSHARLMWLLDFQCSLVPCFDKQFQ
jgi:hypothetical protein